MQNDNSNIGDVRNGKGPREERTKTLKNKDFTNPKTLVE